MKRLVAILLGSALWLLGGISAAQSGASFKVVANASVPTSSLTKARASGLFLKEVTRWANGAKVLPVDQLKGRSVREAFSREIHGREVRSIVSYWQAQIFSGRATAPPQLSSDREVLSYVRSNAGAVGYVSAGTSVGDGVKVLKIAG